MRFGKRLPVVATAVALAAVLLAGPSVATAGVTITKAKMLDKTNGGEVTSGLAQVWLSVDFVADATTDCEDPALTYTWDFGDGITATGKTVSHVYGTSGAGNRSPSVTVTDNCGGSATQGGLSVAAISGIDVKKIGDISNPTNNGRVCFDAVRGVEAAALPAGVDGSDKIDWRLQVGLFHSETANMVSGDLAALPSWPTYNSYWGSSTLAISIDGPLVPGQQGEMALTGTVSYISNDKGVKVFYDGAGDQNPSVDPNWFYYYKDNAGGGAYTYANVDRSSSTRGGGVATVKIGNTAYSGGEYITHNYTNPGGRLKATGWSATNKYYANFLGILAHETQHATNEISPAGGPNDPDSDWLTTDFENGTSLTDPNDNDSARGILAGASFTDDEVYAGGPVEKGGFDGADTSADWAHPGTQWP